MINHLNSLILLTVIIILFIIYLLQNKRINILEDLLFKNFISSNHDYLDSKVKEILKQKNIVEAVKLVRKETNLNLKNAKKYIDSLK